jgi:hypothetical protein
MKQLYLLSSSLITEPDINDIMEFSLYSCQYKWQQWLLKQCASVEVDFLDCSM